MEKNELHAHLDKITAKRIRLVAENAKGQFSSTWMFWGNKNDFYFGSKTMLGSFKVSLHENGVGYVAFHKPYFLNKKAEGIELSSRTVLEWRLPVPEALGAVHAASVLLPADYCRSGPLGDRARRQTIVFGVEDGCAAEIGIFLSREKHTTLEAKLLPLGHPIVMVSLENDLNVSVVVRLQSFDPRVLPTDEQRQSARGVLLEKSALSEDRENLNAMIWNKPGDGGVLQVIDVGGVSWKSRPITAQN